jgi:hypothetical protein
MKNIFALLILTFAIYACNNNTQKETSDIHSNSEYPHQTSAVFSEFQNLLRPNEKLGLGKIYTDTIEFIEFDDNGDYPLMFVSNGKDTASLVYDWTVEYDFVKGEKIEIQWKIDSIHYAGDQEYLDYKEFLVSAKKLKPLKLTDKKVKFLWRELQYLKDLNGEFNVITLDEEYIKTISEPEKAALAYVATFVGNECVWDGNANESRSNLKCKIPWALGLGYQCSPRHLDFLRFWFRSNKDILKQLESCPTTPDGATVQDTFDKIDLEIEGNMITIFFKANGFNLREGKSWSWTEKHYFEFKNNELILGKKDVSAKVQSEFEVRGN